LEHKQMTVAKQKIAILGGGVGAMTTAWQLTREPGWQERYDITVYQMGWRLGGKGASGRRAPHWRIEEHGLHIWLGFYHNAFRALQEAFVELNPIASPAPVGNTPPRIANGVFARCEDAFLPHSYVGVYQENNGQPAPWMMDMPTNDEKPWEGDSLPSVWSYIQEIVRFMVKQGKADTVKVTYIQEESTQHLGLMGWLRTETTKLVIDIEEFSWSAGWAAMMLLAHLVDNLADDVEEHDSMVYAQIESVLRKLQDWLTHEIRREAGQDIDSLRHLLLIDTCAAILRGLLEDKVFDGKQLNELDDEFCVWLQRHGALPETCSLTTNPLLRGVYDFVFAFDGGDSSQLDKTANFATAPALRTIFRMCFTYDGAIFWKMRAGMGDTIFTPLYKALEKRGVAFKFFHKVTELALSEDGKSIARIDMARQVTTAKPYQPLVSVNGLDCWPSVAQYDQISEGAALQAAEQAQHLSLESLWFNWPNAENISLQKGRDFDTVVYGISLGSVPLLCPQLCAANAAWKTMVDKVKTVCTMGFQVWLKPELKALGWPNPSAVIDAFDEPLDTWADMSHLLPMEMWGAQKPASIAYFCGALQEEPLNPEDKATPARAALKVEAATQLLLGQQIRQLWPAAVDACGALDPTLVVDRYQRANIDPSERYVMSVAGSSSARLKANATGFDNLVITGDWIDNGFNAGCVEASTMAGMQAGNAVLGRDLYEGVIGTELC
jgi:uncharacterized protein with NAD-binding domain and iron-sulfur cluster